MSDTTQSNHPHLADIGVVGLAVMGQNLVLNMDDHDIDVAVYNRTTAVSEAFMRDRAEGTRIQSSDTLEGLVAQLKAPRTILLMVQAGRAVDAVHDRAVVRFEGVCDPLAKLGEGGRRVAVERTHFL